MFRPRCVDCKLWQLGHNILRFSNRLSRLLPLIWSSSKGSRPSADFFAQPQISHCGDFNFAANKRFFNLWLWKLLSSRKIFSKGIRAAPKPLNPLFQPLPRKCFILILYSDKYFLIWL